MAADEPTHCMYVVECADLTLYTGYTVDVEQRIATHNAGRGAKYTQSRRPVRLLAVATFQTKHEAMGAEFRFKQLTRARKMELIAEARDGTAFEMVLAREFSLGG